MNRFSLSEDFSIFFRIFEYLLHQSNFKDFTMFSFIEDETTENVRAVFSAVKQEPVEEPICPLKNKMSPLKSEMTPVKKEPFTLQNESPIRESEQETEMGAADPLQHPHALRKKTDVGGIVSIRTLIPYLALLTPLGLFK